MSRGEVNSDLSVLQVTYSFRNVTFI